MKKTVTSITLCLIAGYFVLTSYSTGPAGTGGLNRTGSQGSIAGCGTLGCHDPSANTVVTIEVDSLTFPVTHYVPGSTYTVKVLGTNSANQPRFGFQFSAVKGTGGAQTQAGTFSGLPANTHQSTVGGISIVEHSSPLVGSSGSYSASFTWTAPVTGTGTVSLYAALNAVNFNGVNSGDQYNTTSTTLSELNCSTAPTIGTQPVAQSACTGSAATFTVASSSVGATYQWKLGTNNIPGATNSTYTIPSVSSTDAGNYSVVVSNACGSTTSSVVALTVNTLPVPVINQSGLVLTTGSFAAYQWERNGANISGATTSSYTVTSNGTYTVKVTDANGCQNTAPAVNITSLGIANVNGTQVTIGIFPNPAKDIVTIQSPVPVNVVIKDIAGRQVLTLDNATVVDVHSLADGLYFMNFTDKSGRFLTQERFIKR